MARTCGDPGEDSDVDLLVVLPFEGHAAYQAARIRRRLRPRFPLDLVVRTPEEMRWRLGENDWFLREIMDQGEVLYEAADRAVKGNDHDPATGCP